jgi:predicted small lipoprotein YifL
MRLLTSFFVLLGVLLALTACGKKGDLYLPDAPDQKSSQQSRP